MPRYIIKDSEFSSSSQNTAYYILLEPKTQSLSTTQVYIDIVCADKALVPTKSPSPSLWIGADSINTWVLQA